MPDAHSSVRAGDSAPEFELPAADRDGNIALRDYLGHSPVLLGLFRGMYCAFRSGSSAMSASPSIKPTSS